MARNLASGEPPAAAPAAVPGASGADGDRRRARLRGWALALLPPLVIVAAAALLSALAEQRGQEESAQRARERLSLYRETVMRELEKFRYLPHVLARDPRATAVLDDAAAADASNRFLKEMAATTGADALFVMNGDGLTVAASNFDSVGSFVGRNYAFRPYFREALEGELGQFYAVGATTGKPGLFFSRATPPTGPPRGVVVVKVDLGGLEQSWREAGETVFVTDRYGVVFLGTRDDWRYASLEPLTDMVVAAIRANRQYGGVPLPSLQQGAADAEILAIDGQRWRQDRLKLGLLGWTIHYLTPMAAIETAGNRIWPAALALVLFHVAVVLALRGRRLDQLTARLKRDAAGLRRLNGRLEAEIEERRRIEAELRAAQADLARASRLAAVGQMSAAVAHELNQPLAALGMFVSGARLLHEQGDRAGLRENLDEIDALRHRMASLTQELKRFARPGESRIERVDLRDCLGTALKLVRPRIAESGVEVRLDLPDAALIAVTAPLRVEQVLVNLLRNAIDACQHAPAPRVEMRARRDGQRAVIEVSDNGGGIPPDLQERIFEPFFSTKPASGGLGLGLAISARIVEDLGGRLDVQANRRAGACFGLSLPLASEVDAAEATPHARLPVPGE